jgi:hypothetical protein
MCRGTQRRIVHFAKRFSRCLTTSRPRRKLPAVKRAASILLLIWSVALGTGALQYLHNLQHLAEDAHQDALDAAAGKPVESHHHDEGNCPTHAALFFAFFFDGWTSYVVYLGLLISFLALLDARQLLQLLPFRIDCRGPPIVA